MKTMKRNLEDGQGLEVIRVKDTAVKARLKAGWSLTNRSTWKRAKAHAKKQARQ